MKKENYKYWRLGLLIVALLLCASAGVKQHSLLVWLGSSALVCLLLTPYLIADWGKKRERENISFHKTVKEYVSRHNSDNKHCKGCCIGQNSPEKQEGAMSKMSASIVRHQFKTVKTVPCKDLNSNWDNYYRNYRADVFKSGIICENNEVLVHVLRLEDDFPLDSLASESTSLDAFIVAIGEEMYSAAMRINTELSEKTDKKYFTVFEYLSGRYNIHYSITPKEVAWFYMLLNREKVMHFLDRDQLNKLDGLLAADHELLYKNHRPTQTPEFCANRLTEIRKLFTDPECTVFNWRHAANKVGKQSEIAKLYAYLMGCPEEVAADETEKNLSELIDPKLRELYSGWEMYFDQNKNGMFKCIQNMSLEKWLSFEHPFFKAHSTTPSDAAKNYYELFYSGLWPFYIDIYGYVDCIHYKHVGFEADEDKHKLSTWLFEFGEGTDETTHEELILSFISEHTDVSPLNDGACGIPCDGWYDKDGHRFLINPLGMTGLFEISYIWEETDEYGDLLPLDPECFNEPYKSLLSMSANISDEGRI